MDLGPWESIVERSLGEIRSESPTPAEFAADYHFHDDPRLAEVERAALTFLPYVIAGPLAQALRQKNELLGEQHLERTFDQMLKLPVLILVSTYLERNEPGDPVINDAVRPLERATYGLWEKAWRTLDERLPAQADDLVLSICLAHRDLQSASTPVITRYLEFRNRITHKHEDVFSQKRLALLVFLSRMLFLRRYEFLRRKPGTLTRFRRLTGAEPANFGELTLEEGERLAGLLFIRRLDGRLSRFFPWIVDPFEVSQPGSFSSLDLQEMLLFHERGARTVTYMGPSEDTSWSEHLTVLEELIARKGISGRVQTLETCEDIRDALWSYTNLILRSYMLDGRYVPEMTVERSKWLAAFTDFVTLPEYRILLLLGGSGSGKSTLCCQLAERCMQQGHAVLLLSVSGQKQVKPETLVGRALGLARTEDATHSLRLWADGSGEKDRLTIIIDGLNEAADPGEALRQVDSFAASHNKQLPGLRIVVSMTAEAYASLRDSAAHRAVPLTQALYYRSDVLPSIPGGGPHENYVEPLSESLAQNAYERCRRCVGFSPVTPWEELSEETRQLVRNPWHLRWLTTTYTGREIPWGTNLGSLLQEFATRLANIHPYAHLGTSTGRAVLRRILQLMLDAGRDEIALEVFENHDELATARARAAYRDLREAGILVEISEGSWVLFSPDCAIKVRFSHDRLFDFLMAHHILSGAFVPSPAHNVDPLSSLRDAVTRSRRFCGVAVAALACLVDRSLRKDEQDHVQSDDRQLHAVATWCLDVDAEVGGEIVSQLLKEVGPRHPEVMVHLAKRLLDHSPADWLRSVADAAASFYDTSPTDLTCRLSELAHVVAVGSADDAALGEVELVAGKCWTSLLKWDKSREAFHRSAQAFTNCDRPERAALATAFLARVFFMRGDYSAARTLYDEALASLESRGNRWERANVLNLRAYLAYVADGLVEGESHYLKAQELAHDVGHRRQEGIAHLGLSNCSASRGHADEAMKHAEAALKIFKDLADRNEIVRAYVHYTTLVSELESPSADQLAMAEERARRADDISVVDHDPNGQSIARIALARLSAKQRRYGDAEGQFASALQSVRGGDVPLDEAWCLEQYGDYLFSRGHTSSARKYLEQARVLYGRHGIKALEASLRRRLKESGLQRPFFDMSQWFRSVCGWGSRPCRASERTQRPKEPP